MGENSPLIFTCFVKLFGFIIQSLMGSSTSDSKIIFNTIDNYAKDGGRGEV